MRKLILLILVAAVCFILPACGHEHAWQPSTCTSPKLCASCGEVDGEALGHSWMDATCEESRFCSICGLTSGEPAGHMWSEATCVNPAVCDVCNKANGVANGHSFLPATCVEGEICSVCGEKQGSPLGHTVEVWETTTEATCSNVGAETGICTVCADTCNQEVPMLEHTPGEWEVTVQPTLDAMGTRVKNCTVCGAEVEQEEFTLSDEEIEKLYKSNCESISYDSLSRKPSEYEDRQVKFSGYIVQVCYEAESPFYYSTYRVATSGRYNNVIYIKVDNYGSDSRILEDDYVTFYGKFSGLYTYETVMGASITIPSVTVEYID